MAEALVLSAESTVAVFGTPVEATPGLVGGEEFRTQHDVDVQFVATTLGLEEQSDGSWQVTGNTVPRLCEAVDGCAATKCGLAELAMDNATRRQLNCAAANTEPAFGGRPGFVMTPLSPDVVFLGDKGAYQPVTAKDESGQDAVFFNKVKTGSALVTSEDDMKGIEGSEEGIYVGLNLADSVVATETLDVDGMRYAVVLYSSRENLGDREQRFRIARNAVEGILERHGYNEPGREADRAALVDQLTVQIDVGFSATLKNFAHEVFVPEIKLAEGMTAGQALAIMDAETEARTKPAERDKRLDGGTRYALTVARQNNLVDEETGVLTSEVTPTMVMADQYPGALESGEIYGQFEGEAGLEDAPRGPGGCPGHGELCHINYPKITKRTRVRELRDMGVREENITYSNDQAIDPSASDNMLPSNRRMQLEGVDKNKTLRTVQGAVIKFPPR
jgi:hypothetical protein